MSGAVEYYQGAIATISNSVTEYRQGLARIDREFDAACDRLDQSILGLHGDAAKHCKGSVNAQQRKKDLRQQADGIEREVAKSDKKIAAANQGIAAVESDIGALGQEKSGLERQISDRWLIMKIYYFFAEDNDEEISRQSGGKRKQGNCTFRRL